MMIVPINGQGQASTPVKNGGAPAYSAPKAVAEKSRPETSTGTLSQTTTHQATVEIAEIKDGKVQLSVDRDTGRVIGRVIDRESGEVIRQFPSEEIVRLIAATNDELGPLYSTGV